MGHAHHFLSRLDRVSQQQVELSLGLYNNVPLLKFILSRSGLPKGAGRAAISLDDRNEGPFLIVTTEGRFVTCLARGMVHDLPIVRRWQLDQLSARHEELRRCMRPIAEIPEDGLAFMRLFRPIFESGPNLSREQFRDLAPWQPMMFDTYIDWIGEMYDRLVLYFYRVKNVDRARSTDNELLEIYWNDLWAIRHMLVLLGVGEPVEFWESRPREVLEKVHESAAKYAALECASPLALAGAWCTARFGGAYVPICSHWFEHGPDDRMHQAAFELSAIASAHPGHRELILGALRSSAEAPANDSPAVNEQERRASSASKALRSFERDDLDVRAAKYGAELLFARKHPVIEKRGWRSPLDVPLDVALPYAAQQMQGWIDDEAVADALYNLAPSVALYRPEDFYLPARWLRDMRAPWTPELTLKHLRWARKHFEVREPTRTAAAPGRNDPCPCGSEKKYKKCCALKANAKVEKAPAAEPAEKKHQPSLADGVMPRQREAVVRASLFPAAPGRAEPSAIEDESATQEPAETAESASSADIVAA
ncbi:MAG: SEC-C metal-binding domain-containing protein [Polyangiales bacterium]